MKYLLWCLLLVAQQGLAQDPESSISDDQISNASGNPYLFKDWVDGVVFFKSGRVVKQFKLRFDCARNRLMLQFEGNAFAAESQVKEFVLYTPPVRIKTPYFSGKGILLLINIPPIPITRCW
ncbi:hypothetical protein [Paraflavitalea speifideaquila]|uniref:hypothetical protein n=1 Tax=Paraflavitalea speifideaquila TaxID=3076558 RepID=UPI0028EAF64B|nr:hypothetical protein [Paraflavitalea speifideiaquila]